MLKYFLVLAEYMQEIGTEIVKIYTMILYIAIGKAMLYEYRYLDGISNLMELQISLKLTARLPKQLLGSYTLYMREFFS